MSGQILSCRHISEIHNTNRRSNFKLVEKQSNLVRGYRFDRQIFSFNCKIIRTKVYEIIKNLRRKIS